MSVGGGEPICSFGEHAKTFIVTYVYNSLKILKIIFKTSVQNFFSKIFFDPKFSKIPFLTIFGRKFDKSREPAELIKSRDA